MPPETRASSPTPTQIRSGSRRLFGRRWSRCSLGRWVDFSYGTTTNNVNMKTQAIWMSLCIMALCAFELHQYDVFFVQNDLYELVPRDLLRAVKMLK